MIQVGRLIYRTGTVHRINERGAPLCGADFTETGSKTLAFNDGSLDTCSACERVLMAEAERQFKEVQA